MQGCGRKIGEFDCCTIVCGDSRELLPRVPEGYVNLCLTDPPYGVGLEYDGYNDTSQNLKQLVQLVMPEILRISPLTLLTPGIKNISFYPQPDWILCWYYGRSYICPWGVSCWQPIYCYGADPLHDQLRDDVIKFIGNTSDKLHPCPKPHKFWRLLIKRTIPNTSNIIKRVIDPFSGSGTTAITCKHLGLHFLCFEQSQKYVEESIRLLDNTPDNMFTDLVLDNSPAKAPHTNQEATLYDHEK